MERTIPEEVKQLIEHYIGLDLGGKKVRTPYFRNVKRVRAELRSLVGKGTPEEIEEETMIYAKLRGFDLEHSSEKEIREFMQSQGVGADCSGFVSHILDKWLRTIGKGSVHKNLKYPKANLYRSFLRNLRPIENISADLLTNSENTEIVKLKDVKPGDLLRLKGVQRGDHVAMIYEVVRKDGVVKKFVYVHSNDSDDETNGVRFGEVIISDENKELKDQDWTETNSKGERQMLKRLEREYEDNGLRRPKFFV